MAVVRASEEWNGMAVVGHLELPHLLVVVGIPFLNGVQPRRQPCPGCLEGVDLGAQLVLNHQRLNGQQAGVSGWEESRTEGEDECSQSSGKKQE